MYTSSFLRKLLCAVLILCLFTGMLPAAQASSLPGGSTIIPGGSIEIYRLYDLYLGGIQVNGQNKDDITSAINSLFPDTASGIACFDPDTNTLTLKDFTYKGKGYSFHDSANRLFSAVLYSELEHLKITVLGDNHLTNADIETASSCGIYTKDSLTLTKDGNGSLTVESAKAEQRSLGVYLYDGNLTLENGTLIATGTDCKELSTGLWCLNGDVSVHSNSHLKAYGGSSNISRGLCVYNELSVNGTVEAESVNNNQDAMISHGLSTGTLQSNHENSITIAKSGAASGESVGIYLWNPTFFAKGLLSGSAGECNQNSYGIYIGSSLTTSGGVTEAHGQTGAFNAPPSVDPLFADVKAWYGESKVVADAAGAQSADNVLSNFSQKYMRIKVEKKTSFLPDTGDPLPAFLLLSLMLTAFAVFCSLCFLKRKN